MRNDRGKLILDARRDDRTVHVLCVQIPERLRQAGILDGDGSGFTVRSRVRPGLCQHGLCLPGSDRQQDHAIASWGFGSEDLADACMDSIREAVARINESGDAVPSPDPSWVRIQ